MSIKLVGTKEIAAKLKRMSEDIRRRELDRAGRAGTKVIADEARDTAPVDSGQLKKSIIVRKQRALSSGYRTAYAVGVGKKAWYFPLVEFGTKAHTIRPRARGGKQVLASGGQVFGRSVRHPGTTGKGFFRAAFESQKEAAVKVAVETLRRRIMRR